MNTTTTTKTISAPEGDVPYKTRECEHCGNDALCEQTIVVGLDMRERPIHRPDMEQTVHEPEQERVFCLDCSEKLFGYNRSLNDLLLPRRLTRRVLLQCMGVGAILAFAFVGTLLYIGGGL